MRVIWLTGPEARRFDESLEPYMNFAVAIMGEKDTGPAIEALGALPLENRYTWRVASALKWAFADFDTINVKADHQTLTRQDRQRIAELLSTDLFNSAFS